MCISCYSIKEELVPHPIFMGGLCKTQCLEDFKNRFFVIADDGKNVCCIICSEPGNLMVCDNEKCSYAFCEICFDALLVKEDQDKIKNDPCWNCMLCSKEPLNQESSLKIRTLWNAELLQMMNDNIHKINFTDFEEKRPIRVLSLFDGICTGKYVLDQLGIVVEKYWACEIEEDAIMIAKINHGKSIHHIGDITKLTMSEINGLGRIDLVLAGSPCNDFSLVNPNRKGADESSVSAQLFKNYIDILQKIRKDNKNVFYLFENVCPMDKRAFELINGNFQDDPATIDAKYFSAMKRRRYFWSNIPGLQTIPQFWNYAAQPNVEDRYHLRNYLINNLERKALVSRVGTITANMNSVNIEQLPVEQDGKPKPLMINEIEKLFGFPKGYTDNFNISNRVKLIGKSWSVPVIKVILEPLRYFFKSEEQ